MLAAHEQRKSPCPPRPGTEAPRDPSPGTGRQDRQAGWREPFPAGTSGIPHRGPCQPPREERRGAGTRGSHDLPPQGPRGERMSEELQRVTERLLDKEYQVACPE